MRKMGGLSSMMDKLPAQFAQAAASCRAGPEEKAISRIEGIINSMTLTRARPRSLKASRKRRIAPRAPGFRRSTACSTSSSRRRRSVKQVLEGGMNKMMRAMKGMMLGVCRHVALTGGRDASAIRTSCRLLWRRRSQPGAARHLLAPAVVRPAFHGDLAGVVLRMDAGHREGLYATVSGWSFIGGWRRPETTAAIVLALIQIATALLGSCPGSMSPLRCWWRWAAPAADARARRAHRLHRPEQPRRFQPAVRGTPSSPACCSLIALVLPLPLWLIPALALLISLVTLTGWLEPARLRLRRAMYHADRSSFSACATTGGRRCCCLGGGTAPAFAYVPVINLVAPALRRPRPSSMACSKPLRAGTLASSTVSLCSTPSGRRPSGNWNELCGALIIGDEILSGRRSDKHLAVDRTARARACFVGRAIAGDDLPARRDPAPDPPPATWCSAWRHRRHPDDRTCQAAAGRCASAGARLHPEAEAEIRARFGDEITPAPADGGLSGGQRDHPNLQLHPGLFDPPASSCPAFR